MLEIKNLADFAMAFGLNSQAVLDFISDEANQRKFKCYLAFQGELELDSDMSSASIHGNCTDKETKIRIALDGGKFLTKEEWNAGQYSKDDVIGIAVITPCVKFILGLKEWKECWSNDVDHCITDTRTRAQALQIISGYEATKQLVEAQEDKFNTAAKLCWNYKHKNLQWYLPCLLELYAVCVNKDEINELLKIVGGDPLHKLEDYYWSSTEFSANSSWFVYFPNGGTGSSFKYGNSAVRPVVAI